MTIEQIEKLKLALFRDMPSCALCYPPVDWDKWSENWHKRHEWNGEDWVEIKPISYSGNTTHS